MHSLLEPFQYEFMRRALVICVLIGFTNGFLGAFVVLRRMSLMADALSHSLLPGLAVATILVGLSPAGLLLGGIVASLIVALGGLALARSSRLKEETAVACLYVLSFAAGIVLIRYSWVRISLDNFLFGNILSVGNSDLWLSYTVTALTVLMVTVLHRPILVSMFESAVARTQGVRVELLMGILLALVVLAMLSSLQAVGVLLAFGLLILPPATIYLLCNSYTFMVWGGGILGIFGSFVGLLLSYWANLPSGPAIIMTLGVIFLLAYLFGPRYGIVIRSLRRRHFHEDSLRRWDSR